MVSDYTWVDINPWQRYEKSSAEQKNLVLFYAETEYLRGFTAKIRKVERRTKESRSFLLFNGIMIIFSFLERGEIDEFIHLEEKERRVVAHKILSYWPPEA